MEWSNDGLSTMRSAISVLLEKSLGDLLDAHALGCHLFISVQFVCGTCHFAGKQLVNTWGFEDREAVVRGLVS